MKNYKSWGIKRRCIPDYNYNAMWINLETWRLGEGQAKPLPYNNKEFYDVSLGPKCTTGKCPFCYVSSNPNGRYYDNVCKTWKKWMSTKYDLVIVKNNVRLTVTTKPFQIAIGSEGEPTEAPEFCKFLQTVYETNVVPNYTTNGVILSDYDDENSEWHKRAREIVEYTQNYVGGVAVSVGNPLIREKALKAVEVLLIHGNTNVNIHHIISDKESVDRFIKIQKTYGKNILYHVLLPLMPSGRSTKGIEDGVFEYLEEQICKNNIDNVSFGAHFYKYLQNSKTKVWLYEPESFSANVLLKPDKVVITPSSFDMRPVKVIEL